MSAVNPWYLQNLSVDPRSQEWIQFLHSMRDNLDFQEFLRNLYLTPDRYCLHAPAINYGGLQEYLHSVIYAFRNGGTAEMDLERSVERELWNRLLKGINTTHRLKAKLMSFALDICHFVGVQIHDSEWGDDGPHEKSNFKGCVVLSGTSDHKIQLIVHFELNIR